MTQCTDIPHAPLGAFNGMSIVGGSLGSGSACSLYGRRPGKRKGGGESTTGAGSRNRIRQLRLMFHVCRRVELVSPRRYIQRARDAQSPSGSTRCYEHHAEPTTESLLRGIQWRRILTPKTSPRSSARIVASRATATVGTAAHAMLHTCGVGVRRGHTFAYDHVESHCHASSPKGKTKGLSHRVVPPGGGFCVRATLPNSGRENIQRLRDRGRGGALRKSRSGPRYDKS